MDRKIEKKKWPPKKIMSYAGGGIIIVLILYNLIFGDRSSKLNVETEKITISEVKFGQFQEYIPVTGEIIPLKTIYLDAIEGGRVGEKFVEAGTMVEEGDSLLELENTNLLLDIMFREAELFTASNNLRNTRLAMLQNKLSLQGDLIELDFQQKTLKRELNRNRKLKDKDLISADDYEQSLDEYEYYRQRKNLAIQLFEQDSIFRKIQIGQLEASLVRMQNNLEVAKQKLDNLVLRAPISGQLTALNAEIGESKSPGERLGQVDNLDGFRVRAGIDEHYLPRINLDQHGEFDFAGETNRIIIKKIYPEINNGRFDVDLEFIESEPSGIRRGQTVHIRLELGDLSEVVLLNRGGFYQKTGGQWVYILDENESSARKRNIRLGRQNPQMFEVLEGLEPGEKVITSSYDNFGENDVLILD
jgi:HlyD family secretion protein